VSQGSTCASFARSIITSSGTRPNHCASSRDTREDHVVSKRRASGSELEGVEFASAQFMKRITA
jgi:hypothetical protein